MQNFTKIDSVLVHHFGKDWNIKLIVWIQRTHHNDCGELSQGLDFKTTVIFCDAGLKQPCFTVVWFFMKVFHLVFWEGFVFALVTEPYTNMTSNEVFMKSLSVYLLYASQSINQALFA